jgi:UDP-N-acetylmuramoyl-tripeptide--D-alanyl-D-alanine ligase
MMHVSEAAFALGVEHRGNNPLFTSVGTDSRNVAPGELFVALRGERFDAHQFVGAAQAAGAVAALVDEAGAPLAPATLPLIVVRDTHKGLSQLAYAWRSRFTLPVVALTGSSGKTTVKEMLASILRHAAPGAGVTQDSVLATRGNLNNEIGVPLTLLELRAQHCYSVIELGMNHTGEISRLSRLARPDVALINNAGRAHIEYLGSEEAIARAKGEIFEGLAPGGIAVINADDAYAGLWQALIKGKSCLQFGLDASAPVSATYELHALHSDIHLKTPDGSVSAAVAAPGLHNVRNALAAAAAAVALKVTLAAIAAGLSQYAGVKARLQRKAAHAGATLIDDTYNANPESMRAAIDVLARVPGRHLLVLGDMGELGGRAQACHAEVGAYARAAGIERLYALGDLSANSVAAFGAGARHFTGIEDLLRDTQRELAPDLTVLVKGSRFMRMERVVDAFAVEAGAQKT